jgi:hypothetical protein
LELFRFSRADPLRSTSGAVVSLPSRHDYQAKQIAPQHSAIIRLEFKVVFEPFAIGEKYGASPKPACSANSTVGNEARLVL